MPRRPIAPWQDAIKDLQTGDLVFFRGRGFYSRIIQWATGGVWSHVAMVVEPSDLGPDTKETELLLWESTNVDGEDIDPNITSRTEGPMLVRLEQRIEEYIGGKDTFLFSVRYLHVTRTEAMRRDMMTFIQDPEIRHSKYPSISHLLWYYLHDRLVGGRKDQTFFCSELVAATYHAGGLLPPSPPPTSYCPRDFSEDGFIPRLLRSELGEELYMGQVKTR